MLGLGDRADHLLEIADVIVHPGRLGRQAQGEVRDLLARSLLSYPGCAVTVAGGAHRFLAMSRGGSMARLGLTRLPPVPICAGRRAAGTDLPGVGGVVAVGGCLAHAWLVAGLSAESLDGAHLWVSASDRADGWASCGQAAGVPFSFGVDFEEPGAACRPSSRERIPSASGAAIAM